MRYHSPNLPYSLEGRHFVNVRYATDSDYPEDATATAKQERGKQGGQSFGARRNKHTVKEQERRGQEQEIVTGQEQEVVRGKEQEIFKGKEQRTEKGLQISVQELKGRERDISKCKEQGAFREHRVREKELDRKEQGSVSVQEKSGQGLKEQDRDPLGGQLLRQRGKELRRQDKETGRNQEQVTVRRQEQRQKEVRGQESRRPLGLCLASSCSTPPFYWQPACPPAPLPPAARPVELRASVQPRSWETACLALHYSTQLLWATGEFCGEQITRRRRGSQEARLVEEEERRGMERAGEVFRRVRVDDAGVKSSSMDSEEELESEWETDNEEEEGEQESSDSGLGSLAGGRRGRLSREEEEDRGPYCCLPLAQASQVEEEVRRLCRDWVNRIRDPKDQVGAHQTS